MLSHTTGMSDRWAWVLQIGPGAWRDVRYGFRLLRRDPMFTLVVAVTLALGIGGTTGLFTVIRHVLLEPLPISEPGDVFIVYNSYPKAGIEHVGSAASDYGDRLGQVTALEAQALLQMTTPNVAVDQAPPERVTAMRTTASWVDVVRPTPSEGRFFNTAEDRPGGDRVVVLNAGFATRLFGGAGVIGRTVRIDGERHTVIGILPSTFTFLDADTQMWLPLQLTPEQLQQHDHVNTFVYLGRRQRGATLEQIQAQVDAVNAANLERFPATRQIILDSGFRSIVAPLQEDLVREVRPTLRLLWVGALFVLLIGAVNIASLALARWHRRVREFSLREAVGASRWLSVRQLVIEHVLLTTVAAVGGLLVTYVVLRSSGTLNIAHLPPGAELRIDAVVIGYALATALILGIALGVFPLLVGIPVDLGLALREGGRTGTGAFGRMLRRGLVVTQIAVAFVLLVSAGLLLASFQRVAAVDPGFTTDGVLTASVNLPAAQYSDPIAMRGFVERVGNELQQLPGVVAAGATSAMPFGRDYRMRMLLAEGYRPARNEPLVGSFRAVITPGYLEAVRARLVHGRTFNHTDGAEAPKSVIIDTVLARRYWPDDNPVGRRMFYPVSSADPYAITETTEMYTVVGVVQEIKLRGFVDGVGHMGASYFPYAQSPERLIAFAIRTSGEPRSVSRPLSAAINRIDPDLPVFDLQTMAARAQQSLLPQRTLVMLASVFGLMALFLSALGIYGVLGYLVAARRRELAIRMVLGSSAAGVFRLVLREGVILIAAGFVLGLIGAAVLGRQIQAYLFDVRPLDVTVVATVATLLAAVAVVACMLPARRATRISAAVALVD